MKLTSLLLLSTFAVFAQVSNDVTHRPANFDLPEGKAVYVDMLEADYSIIYDIEAQSASVTATIRMNVIEPGMPIFDSVQTPSLVKLDGVEVDSDDVRTPDAATTVRIAKKTLAPGAHTLEVKIPLVELLHFTEDGGVKNAMWSSDLDDRGYLERYVPANMEYDRLKMTFNIEYKGLVQEQLVFANGTQKWTGKNKVRVTFPDYYTINSVYFHTVPMNMVIVDSFDFKSVDGRIIPVTLYKQANDETNDLGVIRFESEKVLLELEKDYGAFPHPSLTIYTADLSAFGMGGMEYSGATVTEEFALGHELFHSYFARTMTPANGNAGWLDEALASWRDKGYPRYSKIRGSSSMASHAPYTRFTDRQAYTAGPKFMGYLDNELKEKGGLKSFMNRILNTKRFTPIFTEDFISELSSFSGTDVAPIFYRHVYGGKSLNRLKESHSHPIHKKMSVKQLWQIL